MRNTTQSALLVLSLLLGCVGPDVRRTLVHPLPPRTARVTVRFQVDALGPPRHPLAGAEKLRPGDRLVARVEAEHRVYVYLLDVDAQGEAHLIFPEDKDNERVEPGVALMIPAADALELGQQGGAERLVLIASARPLAADKLADAWLHGRLNDQGLIRRQREHLLDELRAAQKRPVCARTQAELDPDGLAVLCLSFSVQ